MYTERLALRRFTADDWADLHEYLLDEGVVRYEPYPPQTEEQCKAIAKDRAASKEYWAVCLKENGKLIGNLYLLEKEQRNWEIGYVFNRAYQHKGYATEAVQAIVRYAFVKQDAHRITAYCNPENKPSWTLLERVGFQLEGHFRKNVYFHCDQFGAPIWQDTYIYGLLADD